MRPPKVTETVGVAYRFAAIGAMPCSRRFVVGRIADSECTRIIDCRIDSCAVNYPRDGDKPPPINCLPNQHRTGNEGPGGTDTVKDNEGLRTTESDSVT